MTATPPPAGGRTLGLCMIVRDEAAVVERCLASVRDLVDRWTIVDTGSRDDTPALVERALAGVPGTLHHRPWVDFGHNRSEAIALARGSADYLLLLDADMEVEAAPEFDLEALAADGYLLRYAGALDYRQVMLVRGDLAWRYVGATHEYLHLDQPYAIERLDSLRLHHRADGANRRAKFERDRDLLLDYLERHPDEPRARFYLAQTWFDLGDWDRAVAAYDRRLEVEGWEEESWYATYRRALARKQRGDPWPEVQADLLACWAARPQRLEPLYLVARHHREAGAHRLGHLFSRPVVDAGYPADVLFVEREVYRYLLAFEYAICCYWIGDHREAIRVNDELLTLPDLPPAHVEAVVRNRRFSLDLRQPRPLAEADRRPPPRLLVVVPFFNAGRLLAGTVESLLAQTADGFDAVFVDDGSTDGYASLVPDDPRFTLLRRGRRRGPAACVDAALAGRADADDVVAVVLPGGDRLATPEALATLRRAYVERDAWVTYGGFEHDDGRRGDARPFLDEAGFTAAREAGRVGPPLSFRTPLYRRLAEHDPERDALRAADGGWLRGPVEAVLAPPLFELAGFDRVAFLDPPLSITCRFRWTEAAATTAPRRRREPLPRLDDPLGAVATVEETG